tara:strand:- start:327 stop:1205 length:879 start_codon:yes stop_codon:yes gene_type:complete
MKNLLNISDISKENLNEILEYSKTLDQTFENSLEGKNIGLIFEKSSTRTRLSFQVGINQLKGNYIDIRFDELNLKRFESYEDTFEIMSCYLDCLVFRTTDHKKLELAQKYFKKPIINALSDISHPCQAISDIYTLKEIFGTVDDLNIVWMGDMNNVLFSLIEAFNFLNNSKIDVFTDKKIFEKNKNQFNFSKKVKYHFELNKNIISSAHCIMTDVFTSMNDKENKETLLSKFQVNRNLMDLTNKNAIFMHCLPAKIGSEVTEEVIKGEKSIVIKQAKNKLVAQRGILKWLNT